MQREDTGEEESSSLEHKALQSLIRSGKPSIELSDNPRQYLYMHDYAWARDFLLGQTPIKPLPHKPLE